MALRNAASNPRGIWGILKGFEADLTRPATLQLRMRVFTVVCNPLSTVITLFAKSFVCVKL